MRRYAALTTASVSRPVLAARHGAVPRGPGGETAGRRASGLNEAQVPFPQPSVGFFAVLAAILIKHEDEPRAAQG